ncbi:MAG: flippase [Candidatus Omnitrophica bacterium]|nr:flippase [Candidatus Omnitrophota bacterium]
MEEKNLSKNIGKNILWNFFGQAWMLILTLATMPFIIRRLSVDLYGVYMLIGVIVGYFSFLQFGLGTASIKYISQHLARKEEDKIRKTFWSCLFFYISLGLFGTLLIALSAHILVEKVFRIPDEFKAISVFALRVGSAGFFIFMLLSLASSIIQAIGRFDILNIIETALGTLQIGVTVALLKYGFSLREIIISNIFLQTVGICVYWIYMRKMLPFLAKLSWDAATLRDLLKFGGFVTISSVTAPILLNMEKIFLTMFRSVSTLTYYSVPYSIINRLSVIPSAFSSVIFPASSYTHGLHKSETNRELHYRSTLYIFFLYVFFVVFFVIFGRQFLAMWIGNDFAENSTDVLIILALAGLVNAVAWPSAVILQGVGKPHIPAAFHLIETVIYIPLACVFIYKFGVLGAAFAWFLRVLLDTILLNKASCDLFGERLITWYGRLCYRSFPPMALCCLLFWWLRSFDLPLLNPISMIGFFTAFILYVLFVWRWGLDDMARNKTLEILKESVCTIL